jgi:phenylpropionate dioxygenase-like ring-hydroxylating dioxygenase large terminal subunit
MTFRFLLAAAFVAALSHDNQGVTVSALLTPATNGAQTKNPMKNLDQSSSSSSATTGSDSFPGFLAQLAPYADMPLEHSITLPPRAYTDPDLFAMEKDTIFRPGWICVAHAAQLKNKGDFLTMDVMGERMVIVNNGDGNMEVMSRVCTHRWASICESGKGSCAKFTCPMHKWSFDLKGECVGTPYMEDVADFDKADHSLHKYRSETIGGFVYVNIDGTADSLAPQIAGLTDWMKNWETDKTELFFEELEYECDFNWVSVGKT